MAFDSRHGLGLCDLIDYVAHSHTPQAHCVRFGRAVTGRTRNTRYRAARYALPGRDLPPQDRASFAQRTPASSESAAVSFKPRSAPCLRAGCFSERAAACKLCEAL
jgi:hypothetical protein